MFGSAYEEKKQFVEVWLGNNKYVVSFFLLGLLFLGLGIFLYKAGLFEEAKVEVVETRGVGGSDGESQVVVEVAGAVEKPGVYRLDSVSRVEDLLVEAGGLAGEADREWASKNLNRAAKLVDGQKIYIPKVDESREKGIQGSVAGSGDVGGVTNLNTASAAQLESLPGIGSVRAQEIVDNRPYSSVEELLVKKIVPKGVYEKIKGKVTAP